MLKWTGARHLLAVSLIAGVMSAIEWSGYRWYLRQADVQSPAGAEPVVSALHGSCTPAPQLGSTSILSPSPAPVDGALGTYSVKNELDVPVVALLGSAQLSRYYQAIVVAPGAETTVRLAAGHYGLGVLLGRRWCNLGRGFVDGRRYSITGGVTVAASSPGRNVIYPASVPGDFRIRYEELSHTEAAHAYVVPHTRHGFMAVGAVLGVPVAWLIDTGAASVMLPVALAQEAGVRCTALAVFSTAAGLATGCRGQLAYLRVGPFTIENIDVGVLPGVPRPLLGMSALRQLTLVLKNDALWISGGSATMSGLGNADDRAFAFAAVVPWPQAHVPARALVDSVPIMPSGLPLLQSGELLLAMAHALTLIVVLVVYRRWLRRYRAIRGPSARVGARPLGLLELPGSSESTHVSDHPNGY